MLHQIHWISAVNHLMASASPDGDGPHLQFPGDPTVLGWIATALYFIAAISCFRAARRARIESTPARRRWFWLAVGSLVLLLGVNKQLDLQLLVQRVGRQVIASEDWRDHRVLLRSAFFSLVASCVVAMMVWFIALARGSWRRYGLALFGLGLLLGFVLLRVAFFERMDDFVGRSLAAGRVKWVLEIGGLASIIVSAIRHGARRPVESGPP